MIPIYTAHCKSHPWGTNGYFVCHEMSYFNPPARTRWDRVPRMLDKLQVISIHPPHAGWDAGLTGVFCGYANFNPPTPCGVGHQKFTKQDCKLLHMQQNTPDSGTFLRKISDYTSHPSPFYCQISVRTGKGISVRFPFARSAKSSGRPLAHRLLWPQNARFWSDKHSPDSKTEGCPFSHP